ncbi:MAG: matrixin family metalloprotease, partial [Nitrospirales bacterium]|nr:matrixin family metalloprotease [Nitrospirales bacterium]
MKLIRFALLSMLLPLCAVLSSGGCATHSSPPPSTPRPADSGPKNSPEQGQELLSENAKEKREAWKDKTFAEFKAQVYKEPFEGGKYIVNGDTTIVDEKHLEEFFNMRIKEDFQPATGSGFRVKLTVHQVNGQDAVWNSVEKRQLTYCVSKAFGNNYNQMVSDMQAAGGAWEAVANVDFIHVAGQDDNCTASNANVVFDVRPVNVNGQYLARAFFPNEPRSSRNVLVDNSSFGLDPNGKLSLRGILRHELGHTLGFRHEHTRPDSGTCFEDNNWRPLTSYDAFSVMHYPQCNGQGDWSLMLTNIDQNGAACLYGPAQGFTVDTSICQGPEPPAGPVACGPKTETFIGQTVEVNSWKAYGPFPVAPGTLVEAVMHGEANPG